MDDTVPFFDKYLQDFAEILAELDERNATNTDRVQFTLSRAELVEFADKLSRVVNAYKKG